MWPVYFLSHDYFQNRSLTLIHFTIRQKEQIHFSPLNRRPYRHYDIRVINV
jgi:hypothetical protein